MSTLIHIISAPNASNTPAMGQGMYACETDTQTLQGYVGIDPIGSSDEKPVQEGRSEERA